MQISIVNGSVEYDGEPILSRIDFTVHDKEKIALVGRNGCGKTTLLRAITGEVPFVKGVGEEDFGFYVAGAPTIGFLRQSEEDDTVTMESYVLSVYSEILSVEKKMEEVLKRMESGENLSDLYAKLHERYEFLDGYTYKKEYLTGIKKFGFSDGDMKKRLNEFSGGQRTKISLLRLLLSKPDVLCLDEPTNHLDLPAVEWLEKYLSEYKKSFIVVSHDRMFLDKTVNVVYEIEYGEAVRYPGNYSQFVERKKANYEKELKDVSYRKKEAERLSALVERFRYKAHKAAMAQAKLKQLERLGDLSMPTAADNSAFRGNFSPRIDPVNKVIVAEKLTFGYDEKRPLGTISFELLRGQKMGIIGNNGCGKSTLVRTITKALSPLGGVCYLGLNVECGYFDQTKTQSYSTLSVLDDFRNDFPTLNDTECRTALGSFLFSGEDVFKTVGELSGGEKVRLALCKIIRKKPNLLILDEPTNHMDIIGKETLEKLLVDYTGTILVVSHDRYLINKLCDRLIVFENGSPKLFDGRYDEYELTQNSIQNQTVSEPKVENKGKKTFSTPRKEIDKRERRISRLEVLLAEAEKRITVIEESLASPDVYSDYEKITPLQTELNELNERTGEYTEEWVVLQEELEELKNNLH